ncbi:hypothetical protein WJX72_004619 [[Myrmecia] bisecta]|uniref:Uncharacterized protein n=1 Tax=[Myrmecia] bisecta TaxID=41462 RepID=A0AAW1PXF1_9CHLO
MGAPSSTKKPFFTAKTPVKGTAGHDNTEATLPDRFEAPVACISFNNAGEPVYGLTDKPSIRMLRYEFEQQKAAENQASEDHFMARPSGSRHDAYHAYQAHIAAEEEKHGWDSQLARGAARCRRSQILATSHDNTLLYSESTAHVRPSTAPSQEGKGSGAARTRHHDQANSLAFNFGTTAAHGARFHAHSEFDAAHEHVDDAANRTFEGKVRSRAEYSNFMTERKAQEQELLKQYPHGLPAGKLREARAKGFKVGGLGYGFSTSAGAHSTILLRPSRQLSRGEFLAPGV